MKLNKTSGGYRIDNPTPYYVNEICISGSEKQAREGEFDAVMLTPKSTQMMKSGTYSTP
ncbi:molecular chaperone, partial [Escherichia coli]